DVLIAQTGAIPVRILCGSLINHGTIIGGDSAVAVQNDGGEVCNHGIIQGGSGTINNPASMFDSGIGVDGYYGVKLNTGVIRGGDFTSEVYDDENVLMSAPAVYGIVEENRGEIIGGSIKANSADVIAGPAVYGAVGINTGTIRGGDAHSYAENGTVHAAAGVAAMWELNVSEYGYCDNNTVWAIVVDNRGTITNGQATADHEAVTVSHASTILSRRAASYEVYQNSGTITANGGVYAIDKLSAHSVIYRNTGLIAPVAFAQMRLDVFIDGTYTAPQTMLWHNGAELTVTYTLTFGGKEVAFDGITHQLTTQEGASVSALTEAGKYNLIVTDGETEKKHPIRIRPAHPFDDITEATPYYTDIVGAYQKGLMNGTASNVFSPDETLTRAMLVTMLWRMEGCPYVNYAMQFTDVAYEEWYSEAIRWAASEGIVLGYDNGSFGINDPITSEQMSVILYRYEQYKGGGFKGLWMFRLNYEDTADISDWAYEAICYMTMKGIYCKPSETTLAPKKEATRAEAAVFVNRYAEFRAAQDTQTENP
ncbi:MAG: S-layer homology domain-containing protein, partial [Clostridia bacterium]|nr:S-layer homology domain-containing protein [Clostridia bacterium]